MSDRSALGTRAVMAKNVLFFGLAESASKLGLAASTLIVAAALGADQFGQWSFAIAVTGAVALVADVGLSPSTMKRLAGGSDAPDALVGNAVGIKLAAACVACVGIAVFGALSGKPASLVAVMLILAAWSLGTWFSLFVQGIFRTCGVSQFETITRTGQQALTVGGVAALALAGAGMTAFAAMYGAMAILVALVCLVLLCTRVVRTQPRFELGWWRSIGRDAWPIWLTTVLWLAYFRIDIIILSYISSDRQVGLYNMSYNAFQLLTTPPAILVPALFPSLAHLHGANLERFADVRGKARTLLLGLALLVVAGSAVAFPIAVHLVLGREYAGSVILFWMLLPALPLLYLNYLNIYVLIAADRQRAVTAIVGVGAATNVTLNLLLMPSLDAAGAAIATIGTESVVCVLLLAVAWRTFHQAARVDDRFALDLAAA